MTDLKVTSVENKGGETEKFTLLSSDKIECFITLDNIKHKQTFEYLMNCFRDNKVVDRQKLFLELENE